MMGWTQSIATLQLLFLLQYVIFIQCRHATVDTAEMLSNETLKSLNQTGISEELLPEKTDLSVHLPTNKSVVNNTITKRIVNDSTDFITNLNNWVILGQWARYHLMFFTGDKPIPKIPSSEDQSVLICTVTKFPSSLTKQFVGLSNSFLTMVHYVSFENDISIEGLISSHNNTEVFFALNSDDLYESNNSWISTTFAIPKHIENMTIVLQPRSSGAAKWAISALTVNGTQFFGNATSTIVEPVKITSNKSVIANTTTTPPPTIIKPSNNTVPHNVTIVKPQAEPVKNISDIIEEPIINTTSSDITEPAENEDPLKSINGVAAAIWDAFYVFLALFCACMIALIVLVMKQR